MKTLVLLSGGLDSTTALFHFRALGHEVKALGIHYGQRHEKELDSARRIAKKIGVEFQIANLAHIRRFLAGSSQTSDDVQVPDGHYTESSMKLTVVPNRNMIMLSIAIGWAVSLKFDSVAYAAHVGDHSIYPDCRPEFVESMQKAAELCDWHPIKVLAPFLNFSKSEIVKRGLELDVPFGETWSCYKGSELHCGRCGTCVERKEAFEIAQAPDPTIYVEDFPKQQNSSQTTELLETVQRDAL